MSGKSRTGGTNQSVNRGASTTLGPRFTQSQSPECCASALPATDFAALFAFGSRKTFDALVATFELVVFFAGELLPLPAIVITSFQSGLIVGVVEAGYVSIGLFVVSEYV